MAAAAVVEVAAVVGLAVVECHGHRRAVPHRSVEAVPGPLRDQAEARAAPRPELAQVREPSLVLERAHAREPALELVPERAAALALAPAPSPAREQDLADGPLPAI